MKMLFPLGAAVAALAVTVGAQESTVKTQTDVKAEDGKVIAMTGCVKHDAATNTYSLVGTIASGEELSTRTRVRTETEKDEVTVKSEARTKVEDGAVGTSGVISTYALMPRAGVDLKTHIGQRVQITAVKVERGEGDAEVSVREKTEVERDGGRDSTTRTKTEVEVPRSPGGGYTVMAVKQSAGTCQ